MPELIGTIDIRSAGKNNKLLLGDLNGDGRMELLLVQPDGGIDDRYVPHQICCMTAFDLQGNRLWQVGTPEENPGGFGSDFPAQIYDIDGDGFNEVLCVMEKQFHIFDGRTGTLKKSFPLPDPEAHDCICIANLTGGKHPQDIILKNRYTKMWAMDKDFTLLWFHEGNLGHYPWVYDFDGDGCDEVMAGYDMLDQDGKVLWSCKDLEDHADCIWVGDVDLDPANGVEIVIGGSVTVMYDWKGKERWRYEGSIESQHVALGKFREDIPGIQIAGLDRIVRGNDNGRDGIFLLNDKGEEIWKENRRTKGWLTIIETFHNWNGEQKDHILAYRRGGGIFPTLYDGFLNPVVTFPVDGYVAHGDLMGENREDVVIYDTETVHIFSSKTVDLTQPASGNPLPQTKRLSHSTLYPGGELEFRAYPPCVQKTECGYNERELKYAIDLPNGNYDVTVVTGNPCCDAETTIQAEERRFMRKQICTRAGESTKHSFTVNVRDGQLNLAFFGEKPCVNALEVKKSEEAITVYLAGDSTVTDQAEEPWAAWGQMLPGFFEKGVAIANHAYSGRATTSFLWEKRLEALLSTMRAGDYLFMQFGHNDQKPGTAHAEAFTTYKEYLKLYIEETRKKGGLPVLVTSMHRRAFDENGKLRNTLGDYPAAMRQLAEEEKVALIDLNAKSEVLFNRLGPEGTIPVFVV